MYTTPGINVDSIALVFQIFKKPPAMRGPTGDVQDVFTNEHVCKVPFW
jgi:hypothetical protein